MRNTEKIHIENFYLQASHRENVPFENQIFSI